MAQTGIDQGFQADSVLFSSHWALLSLQVFFIYLKTMFFFLHFCKNKIFEKKQFCTRWQPLLKRNQKRITSGVSCISCDLFLLSHPDTLKTPAVDMTQQGQGQGQGSEQEQSRSLSETGAVLGVVAGVHAPHPTLHYNMSSPSWILGGC